MAPSRVVFHLADLDLFDPFIRSHPRSVLIEPLRKDPDLRTRLFRGYRISKNSPDVRAICQAYHKEINGQGNEKLSDFLCSNWVRTHDDLATDILERLGVSGVDLHQTPDWLNRAHETLRERGHVPAGAEVARALAFDYPVEEILIALSVLSVECEDQPGLRHAIEGEFRKAHEDPGYLHAALTEQHSSIEARITDVAAQRSKVIALHAATRKPIDEELTKLAKQRVSLDRARDATEEALQTATSRLDKAREDHQAAKERMSQWKHNTTRWIARSPMRKQRCGRRSPSGRRILMTWTANSS